MDEKALLHAIGEMMDEKLDSRLKPINMRLDGIDSRLSALEKGQAALENRQAALENRQAALENRQAALENRQAALEKGQAALEKGQASLQSDVAEIKQRVTTIELVLENKVFKGIQLISEGYEGVVKKLENLEDLPEKVEYIHNSVDVLKSVFAEHIRR